MRDPLLAPAVFLCLGIALARWVTFEAAELALAAAAFAALAFAGRRLRIAPVVHFCLWVALGALSLTVHRPGPPPVLDAAAQETVLLEGCVVEPPVFSETREQFLLELAPNARARVSLYLRDEEPLPRLAYGQRVEVEGRARVPRNFQNPGAFDVEAHRQASGGARVLHVVGGVDQHVVPRPVLQP
ncbi:MAG TPA: hypothetical protein DEH78_00530, partial [Solibacterales bacterium]|nr:hypothetical protein [Bryobacterales bacterium]